VGGKEGWGKKGLLEKQGAENLTGHQKNRGRRSGKKVKTTLASLLKLRKRSNKKGGGGTGKKRRHREVSEREQQEDLELQSPLGTGSLI